MNFLQLIEKLARRLGQHQIPLNAGAKELRGLLDSSAVHYELMRRILHAIYARNHCRALTDPVNSDATFEAVAPVRLEVLRSPRTDVDAYRLMEDLCVAIALVFNRLDRKAADSRAGFAGNTHGQPDQGELIQFSRRRRLKFLA